MVGLRIDPDRLLERVVSVLVGVFIAERERDMMAFESWHPPAAYTGLASLAVFVPIHSILEARFFLSFLLAFYRI